ncbi:MAG: hypothetical protein ACREDG_09120, partial [Methylocella sp.]
MPKVTLRAALIAGAALAAILAGTTPLVAPRIAPALAQETEATGGAVADGGSVVEGTAGGIEIGQGAAWLGLGALVALGLALSIAATD